MAVNAKLDITRTFMGWDQPALVLAASAISKRTNNGELDLSSVMCVTPGARAGRILDSLLSQIAQSRGVLYTPPQWLTPGRLVAAMYQLPSRDTPQIHQRLAWIQSLRTIPKAQQKLLLQTPVDSDQLLKRYADLFAKTCSQLAGENIRPKDVPALASKNPENLIGDVNSDRWNALELALVRAEGFLKPGGGYLDSQRELAAVRAGPPPSTQSIILVATSELAELPKAAFRKHFGPVECLIAAPVSLAAKFNGIGCVLPPLWSGSIAELVEEDLIFADGPSSQAEAVFSTLARISPAPSPQDVVISAPDTNVTPHLKSISREIGGVRVRDAAAKPMSSTPACALLRNIADFLQDRTFEAYSRLVRHPHFETRLIRSMGGRLDTKATPLHWLKSLDRYGKQQAPAAIDRMWICESQHDMRVLLALYQSVTNLLAPILESDLDASVGTSPSHWANVIGHVLRDVYDGRRIKTSTAPGRRTLASFQAIASALDALSSIPLELSERNPLTSCDALQLVSDEIESVQLAPEPLTNSIEVLGWLDAALDPAPVAIVTGLNEGVVPEKISTDPLLPESLANAIGLACNATRLGRDAYLLALMNHSRKRPGARLVVIAGRKNSEDDPLWPSRLLLNDEVLVQRIERLLSGPTPLPPVQRSHLPSGTSGFVVMPLKQIEPPTILSVSNFKKYLTSPYEFYLDRVLGLEEFGSPDPELDAGAFGNLIHGALKLFGTSPGRALTRQSEIEAQLSDSLDTHVAATFGASVRPEVQIQIALARRRISRLASEEAKRRAEGWTIQYCEWNDGKATFSSGGTQVQVRGRIDRIDFNRSSGAWEIIDYKTGNRAQPPDTAHFAPKKNVWKDLQLPLYRHLAKPITGDTLPALSYLLLPRDPEATALERLSPKVSLAQADIAIANVISSILASHFADAGTSRSKNGARSALLGLGIVEAGGTRPPVTAEDE